MGQTVIPWGSPQAVKRWGTTLAVEVTSKSYFETRFIGTDQNKIIQRRTELESDAGDTVTFDLSVQLRNDVTYGDARLEGNEEHLKFYQDEVKIDQVRKAVSAGGAMTRQRTVHNLRQTAKDRSSDYWGQFFDECMFIYLSGARGINKDYVVKPGWQGMAKNPLQAPDDTHYALGGAATSKNTLTADDVMSRTVIEGINTKCSMLRAENPEASNMVPVTIDGGDNYVLLMSPYQSYALRTSTDIGNWLDVQKALTQQAGTKSNIFQGGLGRIGPTVLHEHQKVVRFDDYGAGQDVQAARALFMARQAGIVAYGQGNSAARFNWTEETKDYGNEPTVASGTIVGIKKSRFNDMDFGVISLDTAAYPPVQGSGA